MPMETRIRSRRTRTTIPEAMLVEILATFPLITIARFKTVCKTWKSLIESPYFRSVFLSLHKDSSSSWSLMFRTEHGHSLSDAISFHKCKTWNLPKAPFSYMLPFQRHMNNTSYVRYKYRGSSNGLIWIEVQDKSFIGSPVLQQWVELPPLKEPSITTGLVTSLDEDGLVSSFKVVRTCKKSSDRGMREWRVYVYSSETGVWSFKQLLCAYPIHYIASFYAPMNIDVKLYLWVRGLASTDPGVIIAYDFYGPEADNQCQVIPLPFPYSRDVNRCLTRSGRDVYYIEILDRRMKVWMLDNNSKSSELWRLSREEIDMASVGFDVSCMPLAMNPFDSDIIYLWSLLHNCFVSANFRTNEFIVHDTQNWSTDEGYGCVNTYRARGCMERAKCFYSVFMLSQFVMPRWINPVPLPPVDPPSS